MTLLFPVNSSIGFTKFKLGLLRKSVKLTSPYSGKTQAQGYPYALWHVEATIGTVDGLSEPIAAGLLRSFFTQLEGQVTPFLLTIPGTAVPGSGYNGANGVVNGANQTGKSLVTNGWNHNVPIVLEGDYIAINGEVKISTSSVSSDASGNAIFTFEPNLRSSPFNGESLYLSNPQIQFSADTDDVSTWDLSSPLLHDISFTATERFP